MPRVDLKGDEWTFGAEHELADWSGALPEDFARSPDHTVVNTNGVAAQPNVEVYQFGGEINTPPTDTPTGQSEALDTITRVFPEARVNHRSNLHVHVRVPGLKDSLPHLKRVQRFIHQKAFRELLKTCIEPIPVGVTGPEKKRARRRKVSHQTFLSPGRLEGQLQAATLQEFFESEVPKTKAKNSVMWHAQPRVCVNLRQLLQTDTVEFRHFPGTLDPAVMLTCVEWCREFMLEALKIDGNIDALWGRFFPHIAYTGKTRAGGLAPFPKFPAFVEAREIKYQATAAHNGLSAERIKANITAILEGSFDEYPYSEEYKEAARKAGAP